MRVRFGRASFLLPEYAGSGTSFRAGPIAFEARMLFGAKLKRAPDEELPGSGFDGCFDE
jgi:hypothetical protein